MNRNLNVQLRVRSCDHETLLDFAGQVAHDDLLPTHLPDTIKKPKSAKPRKARDKASARAYIWAGPAEREARTVPIANCLRRVR
jgi:hypothetical protein